jgi:tripartite ATP-independent transporter DctM subunit
MIALLLVSFFVLLALGFPIAVALGLSSVLGLLVRQNIPLVVIIQRIFVSVDSFPLMAVPLYMLAANLMGCGGISRRIIHFCNALVGHLTGGLAHVNILASMLFAGISGSAVADTAGIGKILIPHMVADKYPRPYAAAVTGISSTIGIVIPPSIPMVIIGAMLGVSVGKLFLGGIIPGFFIGFALMFTAFLLVRKNKAIVRGKRLGLGQVLKSSIHAFWSILMPVIVIGGIVLGVFTPTEAGAVAVAYAFIVGTVIYRELKPKDILECLWQTALSTAKVFFIIAMAGLYTWLLTAYGFPPLVGRLLLSVTRSPLVMMAVMVLILILITTFMESIATLILLLPILFPVSQQVGIDPTYFGVMVVISIGIGLVTPPVGLCLYISADIAKVSIPQAARALLPFILTIIAILGILLFIPDLVILIPRAILGPG